jgi:hypothetical protein
MKLGCPAAAALALVSALDLVALVDLVAVLVVVLVEGIADRGGEGDGAVERWGGGSRNPCGRGSLALFVPSEVPKTTSRERMMSREAHLGLFFCLPQA